MYSNQAEYQNFFKRQLLHEDVPLKCPRVTIPEFFSWKEVAQQIPLLQN